MTTHSMCLETLAIDAANGVGANKLASISRILSKLIHIDIFNDGTNGRLNEKVKTKVGKF